MSARSLPRFPIGVRGASVAVGAVAFVFSALDGRMYWHEGRLLYAVTHFSLPALLAGQFNPNQLGSHIDVLSSGGYHLTKALHLEFLRLLATLPVAPDGQLLIGSLLSLAAMLVCALCVRGMLVGIGATKTQANLAAAAFLLLPCVPYLSGKLLSEVTALLPACAALWLWSLSLGDGLRPNAGKAFFSGLLIAITALARLDVTIVHAGFAVASLLTTQPGTRARLTPLHGFIAGVAVCAYLGSVALVGGSYASIYRYLSGYLALSPKSIPMSCWGVASFGGLMWLCGLAGLRSQSPLRRFLLVWLVITAIPILAIVAHYMVEPRYLVASTVPLAALAGLGLEHVYRSLQSETARRGAILAVGFIPALNLLPIALMPYEIDRKAILEVADTYAPQGSRAALLVSWFYSDYHFLRYARPDSPIFNVNSPGGDPGALNAEWDSRVRSWYGERYVQNADRLDQLLRDGPVYYLGWGIYPPIESLLNWAEMVGFGNVRGRIASMDFMRHEEQSWLWHNPRYRLQALSRHGQYTVYRVDWTLTKDRHNEDRLGARQDRGTAYVGGLRRVPR